MPTASEKHESCTLRATAKLISLNGGFVLAVCIVLSAITLASAHTGRLAMSQAFLFLFLSLASWIYLIDSVSERICLNKNTIERTSLIGRSMTVPLKDVNELLLKHEGLNTSIGIESLTVSYTDGKEERIPLGPCWRHRDLETFLESVEKAMGLPDLASMER